MKRAHTFTVLCVGYLVAAACSSTSATDDPSPKDAGASPPTEWEVVMEQVGEEKDFLESQFLGSLERVDLPRVADSARRAAELVALGYGELENKRVPGFANYARAAESWLLQLAVEAEAGRAELARELMDQADKKHCVECHDAADKVKW